MTTAAYPLRSRVGLGLGPEALRERPRFGGQSDATVAESWFFGPPAAELVLAATLQLVTLSSAADVICEADVSVTLASISIAATADFAAATEAPRVIRGGGRFRGRVRRL